MPEKSAINEQLLLEYGRAMTPQELSKFLGVDSRTLIKYATYWGGVEVSPGKFRFFEKFIMEVINNAKSNNQTRQEKMERHNNVMRGEKRKNLSRQFKEVRERSNSLGGKSQKGNGGKPEKPKNRHGLLDIIEMG